MDNSQAARHRYDIAEWRVAASATFGQLAIHCADPPDFWATLASTAVGKVSLFDMHTQPHTVTRSQEMIAAADEPYCKLSLQISGSSTMTQDGRTCQLTPGDLAVYVTQRPYSLDYPTPQRSLVVHFPESYLKLSPKQIRTITASPISREEGLGKVAVPLFEQLAANLDELKGPHAPALVNSALNLLVAVISAELNSPNHAPGNRLFTQATTYIDQNLGNPELSPKVIAKALFVSVRHLHSRFAAQGLSVGTYIRTRRLERIRVELTDPAHAAEPIGIISARYGLHDPSHFSRAFKTAYKETPSAYRARGQRKKN